MSSEQDETASGTPPPPPKKRATRLVASVNHALSSHPMARLLGTLWIIAAGVLSIYTTVRTWRIEERNDAREAEREKLVAEREGRLLPPDLALYLWPNHRCRAENNDVRDVLQTTIVWHEYFVDLTSGRAGTANSWPHSSPSASAERLKPREAFEAEYTHKGRLGELVCESTHDCLLILECEVRFHRAADFARYFKHDYAFIETGDRFTTISELRNAASDEHGRPQLQWLKGKERYQRAFSALLDAERQYGFHRHEVDAWSAEADGLLDPFRNGLQKGTHP